LACPAPNYGNSLFGAGRFVRFSAIYGAYWRFMFACWLTCGYFNIFQTIVNKKMTKKSTFFSNLRKAFASEANDRKRKTKDRRQPNEIVKNDLTG